MKRVLFSAIFSATIIFSFAQAPVMQGPNFFPIGTTFNFALADSVGVSVGSDGANQTWDFTSLNLNGQSIINNIVDPSTTANGNQFPGANVGVVDPAGGVGYYDEQSSKLDLLGLYSDGNQGQGSTLMKYSNAQTVFEFPFTSGSSSSDTYFASYTAATGFPATRDGNYTAEALGYGTLQMPFGNYNALKVKLVNDIDDVFDFGGGFTSTSTSLITTYAWFIEGYGQSILAIDFQEVAFDGVPQSSTKTVRVSDPNLVGIEEMAPQLARVDLYPNPSAGITNFKYSLIDAADLVDVTLYDATGKQVEQIYHGSQMAGDYPTTINTANYSKGLYLVRITVDGVSTDMKLVVH